MTEADGHGDLQMRKAGHDGVCLALGKINQCQLQSLQGTAQAVDFIPQVKTQVGGDLVVARASGVQFLAGLTDAKSPRSMSSRMPSRPVTISVASASLMMPLCASMRACAIEPAMSCL
jgi:hypothetical protein